ncbi:MAG: hypothetical protein IPJ40_07960 [Saprospirales bacterium]|nr:hypothetical protein [Saprospirales bacterium]
MKKNAFILTVFISMLASGAIWAQSGIIDLGIFKEKGDASKLEVRLRPTQHVVNGAYSGGVFTVAVPSSSCATLSVVPGSTPFGYSFAGPVGQQDGYDYYRYQFSGSVYYVDWQKGKEYPLITLQINGEIPPKGAIKLLTDDTWSRAHNANFYQELNSMEVQRKFYYLSSSKLIFFLATAKPGNNVQLEWGYEAETELDFTEIEYSVDGVEFRKISDMPAHADITRAASPYQFLHENVPANVNYYRLLLVDGNGVEEYTPIRVINFTDLDSDFTVFPNPTSGPLMLVSRNLEEYTEGVNYQVTDNNGRVLFANTVGVTILTWICRIWRQAFIF